MFGKRDGATQFFHLRTHFFCFGSMCISVGRRHRTIQQRQGSRRIASGKSVEFFAQEQVRPGAATSADGKEAAFQDGLSDRAGRAVAEKLGGLSRCEVRLHAQIEAELALHVGSGLAPSVLARHSACTPDCSRSVYPTSAAGPVPARGPSGAHPPRLHRASGRALRRAVAHSLSATVLLLPFEFCDAPVLHLALVLRRDVSAREGSGYPVVMLAPG